MRGPSWRKAALRSGKGADAAPTLPMQPGFCNRGRIPHRTGSAIQPPCMRIGSGQSHQPKDPSGPRTMRLGPACHGAWLPTPGPGHGRKRPVSAVLLSASRRNPFGAGQAVRRRKAGARQWLPDSWGRLAQTTACCRLQFCRTSGCRPHAGVRPRPRSMPAGSLSGGPQDCPSVMPTWWSASGCCCRGLRSGRRIGQVL